MRTFRSRLIPTTTKRRDGYAPPSANDNNIITERKNMSGWIGDILKGDGSNDGLRHVTEDGASYTTGPAKDPKAEGGTYLSASDANGNKTTIVWDSDGNRIK